MRREVRDYLVATADLILDEQRVLPERGDVIEETDGVAVYRYEVMSLGSEPHWRYSDPYRSLLRIHTKLVATLVLDESSSSESSSSESSSSESSSSESSSSESSSSESSSSESSSSESSSSESSSSAAADPCVNGYCTWWWDENAQAWVFNSACDSPCICDPPEEPGPYHWAMASMPCYQGEYTCDECQCQWMWDGGSWLLIDPCFHDEFGLCYSCNCSYPEFPGNDPGERVYTPCY